MNSKQRKTLPAVFAAPAPSGIEWAAIESPLLAVGCTLIEGSGSRVRFACKGVVASFHRPHPAKEARRYRLRDPRVPHQDRSQAMSVLSHNGYSARVEFDSKDGLFVGHIAGINDVVGFHGQSVTELVAAFQEAVGDYLETCRQAGKTPERPYSGKVMFRVRPETHARATLAAQLRGISLNQWAEEALHRQAEVDLVSGR